MTDFLVSKFVKNSEDTGKTEVRRAYSTLSSVTGLICNIILFLLKYSMGLLSGSISIISDAFNNLSDCGGCIVSFLGCKMASRPADKDHPFGHGRVEHLTSLILSVIILVVGFELFKGSVEKIANPQPVEFSIIVLVSLILSIGVKLWLSVFNMKLGKSINSKVLIAVSNDSRNDVIATSATIIALISSIFTDFPVDGIMGLIVSAFIIRTGIEIIRDTIDELIGKPVSSEISNNIRQTILSGEDVIDVHDLVIHNYGITKMIGSCHIELRSDKSFKEVHEIADRLERDIQNKFNIILTLHTDPVDIDDNQTREYRGIVSSLVSLMNESFSIHDFRISGCGENRTIIFDMIIPFRCSLTHDEIKSRIDAGLKEKGCTYDTVITFDYE
ncbi:MAG: cation transporter [Ruminococcus sp.]|nr:cation transporter [Ruminococcus sp.]